MHVVLLMCYSKAWNKALQAEYYLYNIMLSPTVSPSDPKNLPTVFAQ